MAVVPFPDPQSDKDGSVQNHESDRWSPGGDQELPGPKMSLLDHLDELRKRLLRSVVALLVGFLISFAFVQRIVMFVMLPLNQLLPPGSSFIYTEPSEAFVLYIKAAMIAGLFLASPIVMWQVWLFVAPALYAKEKRFFIPFIGLSTVGFIAGAAFSHYVAFPLMWRFFGSFSNDVIQFQPRIAPVFDFYLRMVVALGLVFQIPSVVFFLARMGIVTARWMLRHLKYAVLVIFILAAIITPSADMSGQIVIALPMFGLYLISIVIAWVSGKRGAPVAKS